MKLVHASASFALTEIGWSSSVVVGRCVVIMGSVVVVRIARSTIAEPGDGHTGPEAGVRLADVMVSLSCFRLIRRCRAAPTSGQMVTKALRSLLPRPATPPRWVWRDGALVVVLLAWSVVESVLREDLTPRPPVLAA